MYETIAILLATYCIVKFIWPRVKVPKKLTKSKEVIELQYAFFWICPECGNEHFERMVVLACKDVDEIDYLLPETVTCYFCKTYFDAEDYNE